MFKLIGGVFVALMFSWTGSSSAALIPPVTVDGNQWLQPLDFVNHSWNDIAGVCDPGTGICNGSLGGNVLTGWTWASIPDLNALFIASGVAGVPGITGPSPQFTYDFTGFNTWGPNFLALFLPTDNIADSNGVRVEGFLRNSFPATVIAAGGVVTGFHGPRGTILDVAATTDAGTLAVDEPSATVGGWFYRAEVASPATLPLLGVGIAALSYSRRRPNFISTKHGIRFLQIQLQQSRFHTQQWVRGCTARLRLNRPPQRLLCFLLLHWDLQRFG